MEDTAPRGLPRVPYLSDFEVNVRTYVRSGDVGAWFFSLDAARRLAVEAARLGFHLPYFHARMSIERDGARRYHSERRDGRGQPARLDVRYRATGPARPAAPGSLDAFLTDRLRLFAVDGRGRLTTTSIAHGPAGRPRQSSRSRRYRPRLALRWPVHPRLGLWRTGSMWSRGRGVSRPARPSPPTRLLMIPRRAACSPGPSAR